MPAFAGMTGGENGGLGYGYLIMWIILGGMIYPNGLFDGRQGVDAGFLRHDGGLRAG